MILSVVSEKDASSPSLIETYVLSTDSAEFWTNLFLYILLNFRC